MTQSRKRPHNEHKNQSPKDLFDPKDLTPEDLLLSNLSRYETEESRIRLLDRIRRSESGTDTITKALNSIMTETQPLREKLEHLLDKYPHAIEDGINAGTKIENIQKTLAPSLVMMNALASALERNLLEQDNVVNLSIYSPTLGR